MLAGELDTLPTSRGHRGRIHLVMRGEAVELQVMMMSGAEARGWATSGPRPYGPHPYGRRPAATAPQRHSESADQGNSAVADTAEAVKVTLRDATASGLLPMTLTAARTARARDPEFPKPAGKEGHADLFWPDELVRYGRNREAAGDGRSEP
jgi:hypothetical protein